MANSFCTLCPADCDEGVLLPAIDENQGCLGVDFLKKSQVSRIVFFPTYAVDPAVPPTMPTDWTDPVEWATLIDNTVTDNTKAKLLVVEGGIPAPEKTTVELPLGLEKFATRRYTLTATVRNLTDAQYEFIRALQCQESSTFHIWYETLGGRFFGGATGVELVAVDADLVYSEGREDYEQANILLTFEATCDPLRTDTPF